MHPDTEILSKKIAKGGFGGDLGGPVIATMGWVEARSDSKTNDIIAGLGNL